MEPIISAAGLAAELGRFEAPAASRRREFTSG